MPRTPTEVLETRLLQLIDGWRVPIDPGCRASLVALIADGVGRFDADATADAAAAARLDEAVDHLRILLDDMTQQVRIQRFDALNDLNFRSAVGRLCPLWPFG